MAFTSGDLVTLSEIGEDPDFYEGNASAGIFRSLVRAIKRCERSVFGKKHRFWHGWKAALVGDLGQIA